MQRPRARSAHRHRSSVPLRSLGHKGEAAKNPGAWENLARQLTQFTGSSEGFALAVIFILTWALLGPWFDYSEAWQLVINTGTTIITFLMVFLIQRTQNKDSLAIHLKLDELVAAHSGASNRLVAAEDLSEEELERLQREYRELVEKIRRERDRNSVHSIDEKSAGGRSKGAGAKAQT